RLRPARAFQRVGAGLVLEDDPAADAFPRRAGTLSGIDDRERVIEHRRDRRATTPRPPDDETADVAVTRFQHARPGRRRQLVEDAPAVLAGRDAVERRHRLDVLGAERPDRGAGWRSEPSLGGSLVA